MATLTDTVPNITYPDAPVITAVTGATFDVQMESYDSSTVENNGEVTYLLEKTGSQLNYTADENFGALEANTNNVLDSSLVEYTGQLTGYQIKTSSQSNLDFSGSTEAYSLDSNNVLDSSLVEYTGQLTGYQIKTSSQSNLDFSGYAVIEPTMNTLTQDIAFTGQLQATIVKVSSAIPLTGFTHASSSFGEGTGASTTTGTGPTQDDSYEILIQ